VDENQAQSGKDNATSYYLLLAMQTHLPVVVFLVKIFKSGVMQRINSNTNAKAND